LIATIRASSLHGSIKAPRSKSVLQRACAAALLTGGETRLLDPGTAEDDLAAVAVIQALGAAVTKMEDGSLLISSQGINFTKSANINCGESGLSLRMFVPIVALAAASTNVNGRGSLLKRPQHFFEEVLPLLDVKVKTNNGYLPISLKGPLRPKTITIDGSLSSQFLTGLLMAYVGVGATGVSIHVNGLVSRPYIDLTLSVMEKFGLPVPVNHNYSMFTFTNNKVNDNSGSRAYKVEGDWSGASFFLVAAALSGEVTIEGINANSFQADRQILTVARLAQLNIIVNGEWVKVHHSAITPFEFDASDCPDLFPPLTALAVFAKGTSRIKGVSRLTHKESNRGSTLVEEFSKLGVMLEIEDDCLVIKGQEQLQGGIVSSRNDHRIAMALAVAGLRSVQPVVIENAEAVGKSYPSFFSHLQSLGASVSLS